VYFSRFIFVTFAMSRWNMRAVVLEKQRRDDEFTAYDDGDGFWWSHVCLLQLDYRMERELIFE
jgi:hypothetical protein